MSLYEGSVKKPIMTTLCFVAVVVFGLFSLSRLPIDLLPDIETNTIMVFTSYPGVSASEIENNVSRPLENTLNSVANLKHITSKSSENTSLITLEFEYGYDIDVLTNDVRDKLDMVKSSLPDDANDPIIFKFSTDMIPILMLSVQATESQAALYKILDETVANPIARIAGVGTVSISGAPQREIYVYCDPNKLEAYNLTIEGISAVIGAENMNIPGGNFDIGNQTYSLRVEGEFTDAHQMDNIVVATYNGANVYLRDVAEIKDTVQERAQDVYNNGVKGAMIIIQKQSGANTVEIANKVRALLPDLQKKLPPDVKLGVIVDSSDNINNTIGSLTETVLFALLFVVIVVFFFLGRWRATVIVAITIPLSLVASFIYLGMTGSSLNIISLSALSIAIGMVVDDSIVVLENITTHIERGSEPKQAAVHGTNEVALSVIASTLTIVAVFFPLTMVSGMSGVLFKQLGWMICIIIGISLAVSLTLTPMLSSQLLRLQKKQTKAFRFFYRPIEKFLDKIDVVYSRMLNWSMRHRTVVILSGLAFFALSMLCVSGISTEFIPTQDSGRIGVTLELPIGTRKEIAKELATELADKWLSDEKYHVVTCNFRVGQADGDNTFASMQDNGPHIISFNISLTDPEDRNVTQDEICDIMRADIQAYPDFKKFQVMSGGGMSMMGGSSSADFEIYGYDMTETDRLAAELESQLRGVKGVAEVMVSRGDYQPEYRVEFDREKLLMFGVNLATAGTYLRNRFNGATASRYREDGEEYDIVVRYAPQFRESIESIENILIYNSRGQAMRVKDLGEVVERESPPSIDRKDRERIVTVSAMPGPRVPLGDVVIAGQAIIAKMDVPSDIAIQIAGSYEEQQDSFRDLTTLAILIVLLVFIVMAAQFESLTNPFIIMFSLPFAFSGVILMLFITNTTLNIMSMLGSIMLIGIVVKNGIVLIDFTGLCRERGQGVISAVVTAGKSRLRPVLMTTLTTILGMIPMAVLSGQGSEMWRPMGIAVIGGLTVSTVLTLIFVPTLYCTFAGVGIKRARKSLRKKRELQEYFDSHKQYIIKNKK
ncbi:MAG: efflux RND transporter permease subunit [Tannerella sp.]|jgi:HAE1 family hydrophobic/amphiphilic exporter-1|nr:efflux RND transporter permease subunit [Tannerella sp.]